MEGHGRWHRILLVDDDPMDLFVNRRVTELCRFVQKVEVVEGGQAALFHLRSCIQIFDYSSIILLDIQMPHMSGFEFLKTSQEHGYWLPGLTKIILLTSSIDPSDEELARQFHTQFLEKPLTIEKLVTYIKPTAVKP